MRPLLRRSELPPIDQSRELDEEAADEEAADVFSLVVVSPCQVFVSNDPSANEEEIKRIPCNITSFECFKNLETDNGSSSSGPSEVTVEFDYELWYSNPKQFNLTVVQLESSMLQHMAKVFGLLECPTVAQSRGNRDLQVFSQEMADNRGLQVFSQEIADLFVGVDSTPVDVPDMNNAKCIVPVQASDEVDATCQPMTGYFTAFVDADLTADSTAEASVRSGLLRLLRLGMQENLYLNGDVRKVSFIGDRTGFVPPPVQTQSSDSSSVNMSTVALTFIILAAFFAFLIGGFLVRKAARERKQEQVKGMMLEEDLNLDVDEASYNIGFAGDVSRGDSDKQGSLASTDELALEPQDATFPVFAPNSDGSADEAKFKAASELTIETSGAAHAPTVIPSNQQQVAAVELDLLFLSTAASPSSGRSPERNTSPTAKMLAKKKKRRKKTKNKKAPDSPDSLMAESLKTLDSIAEEPPNDSSEFEDSDADSESARSIT